MSRQRTQQEYISILNKDGNNEYELVEGEVYVNNKHRLQTRHIKCGEITLLSPRRFITGQRCEKCSRKERLLKNRQEQYGAFQNFVEENVKNEYELLPFNEKEELQKKAPIFKIRHNKCHHEYNIRFSDFKKGTRCIKCRTYKSITKSHDTFVQEFSKALNGEYELLAGEHYVNNRTLLKVKHVSCGMVYSAIPYKLLAKKQLCPSCKNKKSSNETELKITKFKQRLKSETLGEYTFVSAENYQNLKSRVVVNHTSCNSNFETVAGYLLWKPSCPTCAKTKKKTRKCYKKTHEQFSQEVNELTKGEYKLQEEAPYKNTMTHVQMVHLACGYKYPVTPQNFLNGRRCPKCRREQLANKLRFTDEEYRQKVFNLVGDEYKVAGKYVNNSVKVKMKHNTCGHVWSISPGSFLSGTRCPNCAIKRITQKRVKNIDFFKKRVHELVRDEYRVLDGETYKNSATPISMEHKKCGSIYKVSPSNFMNGRRCPSCYEKQRGAHLRKDLSTLIKEIDELGEKQYELAPNAIYINTDTPLEMKHLECGFTWNVTPSAFLRGTRCPSCKGGIRKTHEEFLEQFKEDAKGEYVLAKGVQYQNTYTPIQVIHTLCGEQYEVAPGKFLSGSRCPKCALTSMSKGEKEIAEILDDYNIKYKPQQTFKDCVYKKGLRFDFGIYKGKDLKAVVEYNGIQHYEEVKYFGGKEALKLNQKRDSIKKQYCKRRAIPLIEIRYDEDIKEKLLQELKEMQFYIEQNPTPNNSIFA
ncbi:hypothetical protein U8V72_25610 [Priestia filamentosa]|uniref:hypothetical protein n=1 Tax=Priestia filamentosa TaxID=1402861 RepID=UPI00397CCB7E